jgi:Zn-dependent peptidase ImmA (M78 family)/DNA-binding XRE family transcriptional regulator
MLTSSSGVPELLSAFNPARLTLARKRRGLTKNQLSELIGVDVRSVTAYESGEYPPWIDTLTKLADVLRFPIEFFSGPNLEEIVADSASFRAMSKMTASQRYMALSQGAIALHFNKWIESRFELPRSDVPDLSHERSPESAADSLRRYWSIGELSIRNMIHLLEAKGVRLFSLSIDSKEVDAFSTWKDTTPLIFLNCMKSSEHSRYDAAHELGHLVLHRHATPHGREAEREADLFASAFLMPRASVLALARRYPSFSDLIQLKKAWTVSVAALNRRLHAVGMLSDWEYRTLCIQIAKNDRTKEPEEAPREVSQVLPKIFDLLHEKGIGRSQVARDLSISRSELDELMFGLALASIDGGRKGASAISNAQLALVSKKS